MGQFKFDQSAEGDQLLLKFSGQIDEDASFNGLDFGDSQKIKIDLEEIIAINSCGIREWIKWIRTAPSGANITFEKCPKIIVDQMNMVAGFLPEGGIVESFYVPYYCDETGNEKMVLFNRGKEFDKGEVSPPENVIDDESGEEMEMDVIEAKYFKFIK